jgi:tape measure domain-containing protein
MAKLSVKIEAVTKGLSAKLSSAKGMFKKFGGSVKSIGIGVLGFGTAIAGAVFSIGKMGGKLVQTKIAMETFLGSAEKAKQLIKDLRQFADVTPFDTESILQAGKTLATVEGDVTKILPLLKMLGDISAGSGKELNELVKIFAKIKRQGIATQEELNMLYNAGVFSQKELAESMGKTEKSMRSLTRAGKVGFNDVNNLLKESTRIGGKFGGIMEKQSKTFIGRLSTLQGKLQNLAMDVGGPLQNSLTSITDTFIDWTAQARNMRSPLGLLIKDLGVVADLLESTRDKGSLAKTTGLKDFGKADVATDIGADLPWWMSPGVKLASMGMQSLGFGAQAKGQQAGLGTVDEEVRQAIIKTANNTSKQGFN